MTVSCTQQMDYIQTQLQLVYVNVAVVSDTGVTTQFFTNYRDVHAPWNSCVNGTYQGWGYVHVYCLFCMPQNGYTSGWGPQQFVSCP